MKKICVVGEHPAVRVGGAEVQLAIVTHSLLQNYRVIYFRITDNPILDNLDEYDIPSEIGIIEYDIRGAHGFKRMWGIFRKLKEIDADLYIQYSSGRVTGILGLFKFIFRRKFIFIATSDLDVDRTFSQGAWASRDRLFKISYRFGIRFADKIITKTQFMLDAMRVFKPKKDSILIRSAFLPSEVVCPEDYNFSEYFLWVGNLRPVKNPDEIVEVGKLTSRKIIICGDGDRRRALESKSTDNVIFLGNINRECVLQLMKNATALISTSPMEGFPNVFLEAWNVGTPVISRVNPDEIVTENKFGIIYQTPRELVEILNSFEERRISLAASDEMVRYVRSVHAISRYTEKYKSVISELISSS